MNSPNIPPAIGEGQLSHLACLALLLALVWVAWTISGKPFPVTFWAAVAFPILHQVFVWLTWRLELRSSAISKTIGFPTYLNLFFLLFSGRFLTLVTLAWLDRGSLGLQIPTQVMLTLILVIPGIYAMYSVKRYFGMARAAGIDHFNPVYRDKPFVRKGIFRFTGNGMYLYAFLLFWAIAIGFNSLSALIVAAFSHAYIWVHFYTTEKPDMNYLYATDSEQA